MQEYALRLAAVSVTTPRHLVAAAIQSLIAARTAALIELRNRARLREAAQLRVALGQLAAHDQHERRALAQAFAQNRGAFRATVLSCRPRGAQSLAHFRRARPEVTNRRLVPIRLRTKFLSQRVPQSSPRQ